MNVKEYDMPRQNMACKHCDSPGGKKTYENQVCMPLNGRVVYIDYCIAKMVAALNASGLKTYSSCCGHGKPQGGEILLKDGRMLIIHNWTLKDGRIIRDDNPEYNFCTHQDLDPAL